MRCCGAALTLMSIRSRSTKSSLLMSWTLTTVTILSSCLRTCSSSASSPWTTKVMRDRFGVLGFADGEAVDVEAARGEHAGDVGQHAGLVLHQGRQDVPHHRLRNGRIGTGGS